MRIRKVVATDIELLCPVFVDMERHYEGAGAIGEAAVRTRLGRFLHSSHGIMLVAADDGALGILSMFEMFPGVALRPVWFMKELYVAEWARGRGVGEALIREAAKIVVEQGGSRLDFTTGRDNSGAQRFYNRVGANEVECVFLRFDETALARLAEQETELLPE
ncbi:MULTISPECIES: GNAT family N-acetyltransferase [Agrobacterium]|uniref:GNAT family N-acetyltransferase n=1 Tax=Agrobacterium TaxID=357 RepID=UPI0015776FFB|nr:MULTISPECIES: GNAT family N-acetyltransferase [Agrobacterium]